MISKNQAKAYAKQAIRQANLKNCMETCKALKGMGEFVTYKKMIKRFANNWESSNYYWINTPENGINFIGYGDWEQFRPQANPKPLDLFIPEHFAYSDYIGSLVEKSNLEVFLEQFENVEGVYETRGGYGTRGLAIRIDSISQDMIDIFNALENYPQIDDDHYLQLELQQEDEAWNDWLKMEFCRAIENKYDLEDLEDHCESVYGLYRELCDRSNIYGYSESTVSWYIDLDSIVKACKESDLTNLPTN